MIALTQVQNLFKSILKAVPDRMDCDGCFELSAQFADAEIQGFELTELLKAVHVHLSQCPVARMSTNRCWKPFVPQIRKFDPFLLAIFV